MAGKKLSTEVYITIDGVKKHWYSISADGVVTWHMPKDIPDRQKILDNIGKHMSDYYYAKCRRTGIGGTA